MFIEDEDNEGSGRERKFRWKNVDNTFGLDDSKRILNDNENHESDNENEENFRKMRYEREEILKDENVKSQLVIPCLESNSNSKKKIKIINTKHAINKSDGLTKKDSPFLITKNIPLLNVSFSIK